jgi:DNA-binding XRE family transcriptional regulator
MPKTSQKRQHSYRIGVALRAARKSAGLTQAALANAAGTARTTVISAEAGAGTYASFECLLRFLENEIRGRNLPTGSNLGFRLAALRGRRGLSRATVAKAAGITDATLAGIESGTLGNLAPLEKVALALGAGLQLAPVTSKISVWSGAAVSSVYQNWATPPGLLGTLYPLVGGAFHLDPCSPHPDGPVRARIRFTATDDGLLLPWPSGSVFCNPPYGPAIASWVAKCRSEADGGCGPIIALVPARTDTRWWRDIAGHADVALLKGRLSFGDGSTPAPFPSALAVWGADEQLQAGLRDAFPDAWHVPIAHTKGSSKTPSIGTFASVHIEEIENSDADKALIGWGHKMGPCRRPAGLLRSHGLFEGGRLCALTVTADLCSPTCAGFSRSQAIELARLCAERPDLNRAMLRIWREFIFPGFERPWAVSYQDEALHSGDTYRFDGWTRLQEHAHSGVDTRSGRPGRTKTVWGWHADPTVRLAAAPSSRKPM